MPRPPRPSALYLVIGVVTWPLLTLAFRLRVTGREHVPDGGCVLAANHWSNFDPWPLGIPLFPRRFLRFMAKKELFWPPLGWVIRAGGAFPVDRGAGDVHAMSTATELCRAGHAVVMFPEGTRRAKGARKRHAPRWHTGAARIALDAEVPLVPAAIAGTDRLSKLGPLRVAYGLPIETGDLAEHDRGEASRIATERLREAIGSLERAVGSTAVGAPV
ncbi:MAG TPA: lysophospholipid acyltransferase family protein [Gaiella sp.]|jgi:1-acyl-sn-glycerol-3-phosphate acyltransferase|nr:lysophospholipid acyltransferase family protein [Gaiella sp.]